MEKGENGWNKAKKGRIGRNGRIRDKNGETDSEKKKGGTENGWIKENKDGISRKKICNREKMSGTR